MNDPVPFRLQAPFGEFKGRRYQEEREDVGQKLKSLNWRGRVGGLPTTGDGALPTAGGGGAEPVGGSGDGIRDREIQGGYDDE